MEKLILKVVEQKESNYIYIDRPILYEDVLPHVAYLSERHTIIVSNEHKNAEIK